MSNRPIRCAVVNDWFDAKSAVFWNKDGILKMLDVLRKRDGWEIVFFKQHDTNTFTWDHDYVKLSFSPDPVQQIKDWKPDCILFFCDFSRPILEKLADYRCPKAQCYSGGLFTDYSHVPDIVFVESQFYVDWMKSMGLNVTRAFGTNTELFKPMKQPKYYDAFMPATFASWKRHWLFSEALGARGLVCGWHQPREMDVIEACEKYGVGILHHQMPESLVYLYNQARTVVVTANTHGGSQRTVLEAMACNIPVIAMSDSDKTTEYIRQAGIGGICEPNVEAIRAEVEKWKDQKVNTRDFILQNYSEINYADAVRDGINSIL